MKKGLIVNKYTISLLILLTILGVDILLHKGMSRTILPASFTTKRSPQTGLSHCNSSLLIHNKKWLKAINNTALAASIDSPVSGIEMDLYFDTAKNVFFVYHDTLVISNTTIEEILAVLSHKKLHPSLWLDVKNLSEANEKYALQALLNIKNKFELNKRVLVESPQIARLRSFCDSGFYTSFYTPFFNPYNEPEETLVAKIDSITALLKKYPVSALSGYYFQAPFLMKFFPEFPILTWAANDKMSFVSTVFHYRLQHEKQIAIVLYSPEN